MWPRSTDMAVIVASRAEGKDSTGRDARPRSTLRAQEGKTLIDLPRPLRSLKLLLPQADGWSEFQMSVTHFHVPSVCFLYTDTHLPCSETGFPSSSFSVTS